MSFLSRLFGRGGTERSDRTAQEAASDPVEHKGCTIVATPMQDGGQWRVAGKIARTVDGEHVERPFIRADLCSSKDEAVEVSLRKARQIIDQNPNLFANPAERGPV